MVEREEFEAVRAMAQAARQGNERIAARIAALQGKASVPWTQTAGGRRARPTEADANIPLFTSDVEETLAGGIRPLRRHPRFGNLEQVDVAVYRTTICSKRARSGSSWRETDDGMTAIAGLAEEMLNPLDTVEELATTHDWLIDRPTMTR